jgi:hypothetical protein
MKTKILIGIIIMTLLVGVVIGSASDNLLNITPKDETLTVDFPAQVRTTLKSKITETYWKTDLITSGNKVEGYFCIKEIGKELFCPHFQLVSNYETESMREEYCKEMNEAGVCIKVPTIEEFIKLKQTEIAQNYLQMKYNQYTKDTTQTTVNFGKKTVSLD